MRHKSEYVGAKAEFDKVRIKSRLENGITIEITFPITLATGEKESFGTTVVFNPNQPLFEAVLIRRSLETVKTLRRVWEDFSGEYTTFRADDIADLICAEVIQYED